MFVTRDDHVLLLHSKAKQNKYFVSCNPTDRANNVPTVTHSSTF